MKTDMAYEIIEYREGGFRPFAVRAIREIPLRIVVDGRELVSLLCSGMHPRFLAAGYLFTCGLVDGAEDIAGLEVEELPDGIVARVALRSGLGETCGLSVTSGLGRVLEAARPGPRACLPSEKAWVGPEGLVGLAAELQARSELYRLTRGCHNSSLCTAGEMVLFRSDIGRHNAIDSIVGQCLLEGLPTADTMIVTTGRIASEIALKAVRAGVPVLASSAVATARAVELAREHGLTLIGNLGPKGFWVYNDPGRLAGNPGE